MKYYAVIDTNVVVSSLLKKNSIPGYIIDKVLTGEIIPLLNNEILEEYEEVLLREEFNFNADDVSEIISRIKDASIILERTAAEEKFIDEYDRVFYEILLAGLSFVNVYLVTGNTKHFPPKKFVVTPRQLYEIINGSDKDKTQ